MGQIWHIHTYIHTYIHILHYIKLHYITLHTVHSQTDWAIEDQAKILNSTARPYDEWEFSPLDFAAYWISHLVLVIYVFVVNFDAQAQTRDFRIEMRQIVFFCWMQYSNLGSLRHQYASRLNPQSHACMHTYIHKHARTYTYVHKYIYAYMHSNNTFL